MAQKLLIHSIAFNFWDVNLSSKSLFLNSNNSNFPHEKENGFWNFHLIFCKKLKKLNTFRIAKSALNVLKFRNYFACNCHERDHLLHITNYFDYLVAGRLLKIHSWDLTILFVVHTANESKTTKNFLVNEEEAFIRFLKPAMNNIGNKISTIQKKQPQAYQISWLEVPEMHQLISHDDESSHIQFLQT